MKSVHSFTIITSTLGAECEDWTLPFGEFVPNATIMGGSYKVGGSIVRLKTEDDTSLYGMLGMGQALQIFKITNIDFVQKNHEQSFILELNDEIILKIPLRYRVINWKMQLESDFHDNIMTGIAVLLLLIVLVIWKLC